MDRDRAENHAGNWSQMATSSTASFIVQHAAALNSWPFLTGASQIRQ